MDLICVATNTGLLVSIGRRGGPSRDMDREILGRGGQDGWNDQGVFAEEAGRVFRSRGLAVWGGRGRWQQGDGGWAGRQQAVTVVPPGEKDMWSLAGPGASWGWARGLGRGEPGALGE